MPPIVKFYWLITLILTPASWLSFVSASSNPLSFATLADHPWPLGIAVFFTCYSLLGAYDQFFSTSNLRKNYPVFAYLRYLLEFIRPEIRQYFIASNLEERPFNREQRNLVYQRAKKLDDTLPFGTQQDILARGYRGLRHSLSPKTVKKENIRVQFGGPQCKKPYSASRLNISAMSFGSLSSNAILALNKGAAQGGFSHNTGEGSISPYHTQHGGDLVWQIGTGYFGCRKEDGRFDDNAFSRRAIEKNVKMIEIKLSQGAKPSHGGVLPGVKVTAEIAKIRLVEVGKTVTSPPTHPEFSTPTELMQFVQRLRELCGGKPVGFKLCIGKPREFMAIVKAILETEILPDFITIDGAEGGTGAAPVEFSNRLGTPCLEATYFVHQILIGTNLRDKIKLISSGKTATGFDLLEKIAVGADTVNAARSMMLALGCIQSLSCNTNHCPTGIATQNNRRGRAVKVESKAQRVRNFQHATMKSFLELCGAMGYDDPRQLTAEDLTVRSERGMRGWSDNASIIEPGQLLGNSMPDQYAEDWISADAQTF